VLLEALTIPGQTGKTNIVSNPKLWYWLGIKVKVLRKELEFSIKYLTQKKIIQDKQEQKRT
jgi:hypothetical protein